MRTLAAISLVLLLAEPALAQRAPVAPAAPAPQLGESAQAMLGSWEFSNAERNKICTATFKNTRTQVGLRVEFDPKCPALFPLVSTVAGWVFPDGDLLRLVDSSGATLAEFSEVEDGIYEAPTPGVGVLFLQNAEAAARKPDVNPEPERVEDPGAK
jgi:hypothetical protein